MKPTLRLTSRRAEFRTLSPGTPFARFTEDGPQALVAVTLRERDGPRLWAVDDRMRVTWVMPWEMVIVGRS